MNVAALPTAGPGHTSILRNVPYHWIQPVPRSPANWPGTEPSDCPRLRFAANRTDL